MNWVFAYLAFAASVLTLLIVLVRSLSRKNFFRFSLILYMLLALFSVPIYFGSIFLFDHPGSTEHWINWLLFGCMFSLPLVFLIAPFLARVFLNKDKAAFAIAVLTVPLFQSSIAAAIFLVGLGWYVTIGENVHWVSGEGDQAISQTILFEADPATFKVLHHRTYAKDSAQAWWRGEPISPNDVASFKSLDQLFAADAEVAYREAEPIDGSDGASFELLQGNWARDSGEVYFSADPIGVCDIASFKIVREAQDSWRRNNWGFDNECVFHRGKQVPVTDRRSFKILERGYAKDRNNVFYQHKVIVGADPETFENLGDTYLGRDKTKCYLFTSEVDCPEN